jgi:hypothetical protein
MERQRSNSGFCGILCMRTAPWQWQNGGPNPRVTTESPLGRSADSLVRAWCLFFVWHGEDYPRPELHAQAQRPLDRGLPATEHGVHFLLL